MTLQRVERTWICKGGYGRFRGEWVKFFLFVLMTLIASIITFSKKKIGKKNVTLDMVASPSTWNPRPSTLDKKLDSIKFFKLVIQVPFACHSESIFWYKHLLLKFTGKFKCSCEMNSLSCPSESNNKHGRLREGYMGEQCWTLL